MPVYEYRCLCMHEFEVEQSIKDKALTCCPVCGQDNLERLISNTLGFCRQEAKTLGQLAERNTKRDKGKAQELTEKNRNSNVEGIKELKKLGGMSDEQKRKYVENG